VNNENNDFKISIFEHPMSERMKIDNIDDAIETIRELFIKNKNKGKKGCIVEFVWK
jgi:hypothetical protein